MGNETLLACVAVLASMVAVGGWALTVVLAMMRVWAALLVTVPVASVATGVLVWLLLYWLGESH